MTEDDDPRNFAEIRISGLSCLSGTLTNGGSDSFKVAASNLTTVVGYDVIVSRNNTTLGIGGCGTAAQTQAVTGVTARDLTFLVYACAVGGGTVTAEVRRTGASSAAATVRQRLTVEPIPAAADEARGASGRATRVGTPGLVPSISFSDKTTSSVKVTWGAPSDGGRALTGFGLLRWTGATQLAYSSALVKGAAARSHTYTGLQAATTYKFRIHACNGPDSCGWWTDPPREVRTLTVPPDPDPDPTPDPPTQRPTSAPGRPDAPRALSYSNRTATSFTVNWRPPANTGGADLTGFGILQWEKPGDRPEDSQAVDLGSGVRSRTFSRLTYGRSQGVEIQACTGPDRCSAWASLTVPAMAPPLPSIRLPKTTIAIGERISVGAYDMPVGAVAYLRIEGPIQPEGRCPASGARARAVPRAPSPSTGPGYYDSMWIDGCAPGGTATIRLESQNGSVLYDRRTLTVVTAEPGQVARPVVSARDGGLHVDWERPTDGGTPTHYDVWHREGTSGAWTENEVRNRTSTTITELMNGASYQVQVRAANTHGDGAWSAIVTGTPSATVIDPVSRPTTHDSLEPYDDCGEAATSTTLAKPANLDIVPLSGRRAALVWNGTTAADDYTVEVKETGTSIWRRPKLSDPSMNTVTKLCYTIDLDKITTDRDGSTRGLGDAVAFDFRVKANKDTRFLNSDSLTIIYTPIIAVNGHSPGTTGQAVLGWSNIEDVLPFAQGAQHGKYLFRIRKFASGHASAGWNPSTLDSGTPFRSFIPSDSNRNRISSLDPGELYAIQFRWNGQVAGETIRVRAAREAYVWPSGTAPGNGDFVASYPINHPLDSKVFAYRICRSTFPTDTWEQWEKLIPHAFDQWEAVGNQWGATSNLVTLNRVRDPCAPFGGLLRDVSARVETAVAEARGVENISEMERMKIESDVTSIVDGYGRRAEKDVMYNEVLMFDDVTFNIYDLIAVGVFPQFAPDVGHFWCWGASNGSDFATDDTLACAI